MEIHSVGEFQLCGNGGLQGGEAAGILSRVPRDSYMVWRETGAQWAAPVPDRCREGMESMLVAGLEVSFLQWRKMTYNKAHHFLRLFMWLHNHYLVWSSEQLCQVHFKNEESGAQRDQVTIWIQQSVKAEFELTFVEAQSPCSFFYDITPSMRPVLRQQLTIGVKQKQTPGLAWDKPPEKGIVFWERLWCEQGGLFKTKKPPGLWQTERRWG